MQDGPIMRWRSPFPMVTRPLSSVDEGAKAFLPVPAIEGPLDAFFAPPRPVGAGGAPPALPLAPVPFPKSDSSTCEVAAMARYLDALDLVDPMLPLLVCRSMLRRLLLFAPCGAWGDQTAISLVIL